MTDTITYRRTYPQFGNSTITTKINNLYPDSVADDATGLEIGIDDHYDTPPGGGGVNGVTVSHLCTKSQHGTNSFYNFFSTKAPQLSGFTIGFSTVSTAANLNGGDCDGVWLNAWSPNSHFASKPDATGFTHSYDKGFTRVGECNYGNAWGDFGMMEHRWGSRFVAGLEFFPDWLAGDTGDNAPHKYHASWGIAIGGAAPGPDGNIPKNWIGVLIPPDGIVGKNDHANIIGPGSAGNTSGGGGYAYSIQGSSDLLNPIGKGINLSMAMDVGIDMRAAHFTDAAMLLADDQVIKLGSTFLRGHQGRLQASANGVTWKDIFSP